MLQEVKLQSQEPCGIIPDVKKPSKQLLLPELSLSESLKRNLLDAKYYPIYIAIAVSVPVIGFLISMVSDYRRRRKINASMDFDE